MRFYLAVLLGLLWLSGCASSGRQALSVRVFYPVPAGGVAQAEWKYER